ncbi:serine hydrolase domain-containing protein [Sphingomonas sanxanigenens]|uniref:Beta-lactamase-related domain-containing protein n=1 Tax=Sphingomonas sanxanigenens DSM 19645 = NX02 TaxID=1123269 RepID=W0AIF2_9SPHN|nr:serine hydrolase [Sphingomonas sanxanigenens]AHE56342.1 hypothetical protein NX02_23650 [Sphingomonas sanxanigenens DSM 19645 = NX02]
MTLPPPFDWRAAGIGPGPDVPADRRVTRDNWRTWPFTRWAFQHARELVPSRALPRAERPVPLIARPIDTAALAIDDGEGRQLDFDGFLARSYADALIILHRGEMLVEHYANGMTPATPHMAFSITKSLVGLVAERLIAAGTLDPDLRAGDVVPELRPSGFAGATLRQLLDMTDGTAFDEDYANPDADVHRYSAAYWTPAAGHGGVLAALPALVGTDALPGQAFRYRTPVGDVVGWMLRRATGKALATLVAEQVWLPAGCGDEAYMLVDTAGMEIAGTGFNATARDLARLALWLMAPDQRALVERLLAGGDRALWSAAMPPRPATGSYRGFWWIDHGAVPALVANGVYGQRLWIVPNEALAVIAFGSHPIVSNRFTEPLYDGLFASLRAILPG